MSIEGPIRTVQDGLVLHLDAGNRKSYPGSGAIWADLCGNTNANLVASPTFATSFCGEFILNGSTQHATVSSVYDFATSNKMTAIVWAKSALANWNNYGYIISRREQFIIHPDSGSRAVAYYFHTTTVGWQAVSYTPSIITTYAQYVMSYNAGVVVVYHNGVRVADGSFGATLSSNTGKLEIGKDEDIPRYLNGNVAAVQLYNRALSPTEVLQNYDAAKSRFGL